MIFADKDSADKNSDTDTDSSDGSNEDLLSKVSQEKVLGNLCGHRDVLLCFNIGCGMKSYRSIYIYITCSLKTNI